MAQRAVKASYWTDPRIRQLSANGRLAALYLMTCPQSHIGGLYYLGLTQAAAQTGLTPRAMREALAELERAGFCRFDEETEEVWVVNMLRHQSRSPKVVAAVAKYLAEIHSRSLVDALLSHYEAFAIPYRYPIDTVSIPYRYGSDTDTDTDTDSVGVGGSGEGGGFDLEAIYAEYPKKVGKTVGLKKLTAKVGTAELYEQVLSAARQMAALWEGHETQFCPAFSAWVNQERWQDGQQAGPGRDAQRDNRSGGLSPAEIRAAAEQMRERGM